MQRRRTHSPHRTGRRCAIRHGCVMRHGLASPPTARRSTAASTSRACLRSSAPHDLTDRRVGCQRLSSSCPGRGAGIRSGHARLGLMRPAPRSVRRSTTLSADADPFTYTQPIACRQRPSREFTSAPQPRRLVAEPARRRPGPAPGPGARHRAQAQNLGSACKIGHTASRTATVPPPGQATRGSAARDSNDHTRSSREKSFASRAGPGGRQRSRGGQIRSHPPPLHGDSDCKAAPFVLRSMVDHP